MPYRTTESVALLRRAIADDLGQDVIEYAVLGAIVGIVSVLTWALLATTVGDVYNAAGSDVQGVSACTPDPGGGGCP
jgi:Flp pilus assembly pilin Flp